VRISCAVEGNQNVKQPDMKNATVDRGQNSATSFEA